MSDLEKVLTITKSWNDAGIYAPDAFKAAYVALRTLEAM